MDIMVTRLAVFYAKSACAQVDYTETNLPKRVISNQVVILLCVNVNKVTAGIIVINAT
jgi:hypothetical protein